ncbi:hypothetical protein C4569_02835 [Candidatus Parcubacteria bacterium]|nr:MAG: hypothetical protein C4569_02835 [Candidatus Parcubacteria bacterium]
MSLLYDGTIMPLDKGIIKLGSAEEKKQHITETILEMVSGKVSVFIDESELGLKQPAREKKQKRRICPPKSKKPSIVNPNAGPISQEEVKDFVKIDLRLIDEKHYFEKFFKKKRR